jgi:polysaccharide pyruvyl transferase WcaK-like protein
MVGQGLGPLDDPTLRAAAAEVLPKVDLIALRERRRGPALLADLGVAPERVLTTGDDAVELGHDACRNVMGTDIGLCLRVADYSPVAAPVREAVGSTVRSLAAGYGARLVPLFISEYRSEDRRSTLPLVRKHPDTIRPLGRYCTPREMAAQLGQCRVLVTGAYHLAVFALSQGIPVVGLSSSRYYDDKLHGLSDMFNGGLRVERLEAPDLGLRLTSAVRTAWDRAPELRGPLRERASAQIKVGRGAYQRVFELVEGARAGGPLR